jgi:hypothetical protein
MANELSDLKWSYKKIEKVNENAYYELTLLHNNTCKINIEQLEKVKNVCIDDICIDYTANWHKSKNGYIVSKIPENKIILEKYPTTLYMHRYLMNQFNYDGKISVDHINQDKSDNRLENLRLATQSTQNHNQKHMIRKFIKPKGFDVEFQLPQYIEYVKEEKIKTTKNGKEVEGILPDHFRVVSCYLGFEKHASKSSKLTIKERLCSALCKRYYLVINSMDKITDLYIDGYQLKSIKEFEEHTIDFVKGLCNITLDKITNEDEFPENSRITRINLPKYISYTSAKGPRGSSLSYEKKIDGKKFTFSSSKSKNKTLDEKYIQIINLMNENKVDFIWNEKPDFINDNNQIINVQEMMNDIIIKKIKVKSKEIIEETQETQEETQKPIEETIEETQEIIIETNKLKFKKEFSEECLKEIIKSRNDKITRKKLNPIDIIIIQKLNKDIDNINKSVLASVLLTTDDKVSQIIRDELSHIDMDKITDDFQNYSNSKFIELYNNIKEDVIEETKKRKEKQLSGLKNRKNIKNPDWKFDIETIIKMVKDKEFFTFDKIAEKYKDIKGNEISVSDVQNVCCNGRSYWLDESDFVNRTDISYEEYKSKREKNTRHKIKMPIKLPSSDINIEKEDDKEDDKENDKETEEVYTNSELEENKINSISKRTCDSNVMINIFKDKYTALTAFKTSLKYKNKKGEEITEAIVKQIWNGKTKLFESDFINYNINQKTNLEITYQQYLRDIKIDKTVFSKPLESQEKLNELLKGVEEKTIKQLTITHIKHIKLCGYDEKYVIDLREKIKSYL